MKTIGPALTFYAKHTQAMDYFLELNGETDGRIKMLSKLGDDKPDETYGMVQNIGIKASAESKTFLNHVRNVVTEDLKAKYAIDVVQTRNPYNVRWAVRKKNSRKKVKNIQMGLCFDSSESNFRMVAWIWFKGSFDRIISEKRMVGVRHGKEIGWKGKNDLIIEMVDIKPEESQFDMEATSIIEKITKTCRMISPKIIDLALETTESCK